MQTTKLPRKRGRPATSVYTEDYTVRLEPDTAEWAKTLPGGLSHQIREHLRHLYDQTHAKAHNQARQPEEPPAAVTPRVVVYPPLLSTLTVGTEKFEVDLDKFLAWGKAADLSTGDSDILKQLRGCTYLKAEGRAEAVALIRRFQSET